ncbi:hypothetical protein MW887_004433 [Aspergillus wentii]|nr:hypothetical protein MW887_004433 [Aspergillus wentii]
MIDAWSQSKGMETSMFVNAINTVFLGALTMPKLKECANKFNIKPVLIFIVSVLGYIVNGEIDNSRKSIIFDGLNDPKLARRDARYALTKLVEDPMARTAEEGQKLQNNTWHELVSRLESVQRG